MNTTTANRSIADEIRQDRRMSYLRNHLAESEARVEELEEEVRALRDERRELNRTVKALRRKTERLTEPRLAVEHDAAAAALNAIHGLLAERGHIDRRSPIAQIMHHQINHHRIHAANNKRGR